MRSIESGAVGDALRPYFHEDALQIEYPSLIDPRRGERGLQAMLEASEHGAGLLTQQSYSIERTLEQGDTVFVQAQWSAELAIALGPYAAGTLLHTYSALVFTFTDGRISRMEAYDCYDPIG